MRGWTIPRLVETKHIKYRLLRVGNGALFCSLKYISSTLRFCAGGSFFFAVGPFGPAAFFISLSRGRVAAGVMQQKPQKGATYGQRKYESRHRQKRRFGSYAQPHFTGLCAGFSLTGGATSSLPVRRRIGQRGRCPSRCEGESRAAWTLPLPVLR